MKIFKRLILFVLGLTSLLILGAIFLVLFIDPNNYKSVAQEAVKKQTGLDLAIESISWQFFPNIGLQLKSVSLNDPSQSTEDQRLLKTDSANIAVALMPLMHQSIEVKTVQLNEPHVWFVQYPEGHSNWDQLLQSQPSTEDQAPAVTDADTSLTLPAFAVNVIQLKNGTVHLIDRANNTTTTIDQLSIKLSDIALDKKVPLEFFVNLQQQEKSSEENLAVSLHGTGEIDVHSDFSRFDIPELSLTINAKNAPGFAKPQKITAKLAAEVDLNADTVVLSQLTMSLDDLTASAHATLSELSQNAILTGAVRLERFNPKRWLKSVLDVELPATTDPEALEKAELSATLSGTLLGDKPTILLQPLSLTLDQSVLSGQISVNLKTQKIISDLKLDTLNLDRYLPPAEEDTAQTSTNAPQNASETVPETLAAPGETLIPVETLQPLQADIHFSAKQLTAKKIDISDLALHATANAGLLTLDKLMANTLNGQISTTGTLDVRTGTPKITVNHSTTGLQLNPALVNFLGKDIAAGLTNLNFNATTQGNTVDDLINGLNGNGQFSLENGQIKGLNITEMAYTALGEWNSALTTLIPQDYQNRVPPAFQRDTDIRKLLTNLTFQDGKVMAKNLNADLDGSAITGGGEVSLSTLGYETQLSLKLSESLTNPYVAQLVWPLRCGSAVKHLIPCEIDKHAVGRQIEKMIAAKAKNKAKSELTNKVSKKLGIDHPVDSAEDAAKIKLREEEDRAKNRLKNQLREKLGGFL